MAYAVVLWELNNGSWEIRETVDEFYDFDEANSCCNGVAETLDYDTHIVTVEEI